MERLSELRYESRPGFAIAPLPPVDSLPPSHLDKPSQLVLSEPTG